MQISDIGEFTIGFRYKSTLENRPKITSSRDAFQIVNLLYDKDKLGIQEQFVAVFLNNSNLVIGSSKLFIGTLTSTVVDIRIICATALKLLATSVIVSHNHPSGKLLASDSDVKLTKRLNKSLEQVDIRLLDHLIVTPFGEYISLKDDGVF